MTIRTKLTVWYSAILFVSLLLIGALSYHELVIEKARASTAKPITMLKVGKMLWRLLHGAVCRRHWWELLADGS